MPAATEVLYALGLGHQIVGVTHECDWPPEAASCHPITAARLDTDELDSAEIDRAVSDAAAQGKPLYAVDAEAWRAVAPDVVVVQELCAVCAVSTDDVKDVVRAEGVDARLLQYSPGTLGAVAEAIVELGRELGVPDAAARLRDELSEQLRRLDKRLVGASARPRVFVSEWLDPPYVAGHWVPEMVALAGGTDVAGTPGEPSFRIRWRDAAELRPDVVVLAPCGYDLDRTLDEVDPAALSAELLGTPAGHEGQVFAVDAKAYYSSPGPRVGVGAELLGHLLHPEAVPDPGVPWARLQI